ncbi:MAG: TraR/DksA C4-type zinc finger protein [Bacteroidales bacterium]|nr:TraR/DksA C4-type zinc finger protein [Bacteroidales bacterium]
MSETKEVRIPKARYSDAELAEFKALILEKLAKAKEEYSQLMASITHRSSNDVMDTSPRLNTVDEGATGMSQEENNQLAQRQLKFIANLEAALIRIENKSYGICRVTGELIPKERLRMVPHATTSVKGKELEKK